MNRLLYQVTVDGINYLVDEEAELKEGKSFYNSMGNYIGIANKAVEECHTEDLNVRKAFHKVIAVEYPNKVEELLQYKLPDEYAELQIEALKLFPVEMDDYDGKYAEYDINENSREAYIEGYKANKALYTEEDMRNIFREGYNLCLSNHFNLLKNKIHPDEVPFEEKAMDADDFLQSLNKPKEIESVEVEYETSFYTNANNSEYIIASEGLNDFTSNKYILDENKLLIINKINYKKIAIELDLPILKRKWDKIDMNKKFRTELCKDRIKFIKEELKKRY